MSYYRVMAKDMKPHFCLDSETALNVAQNLRKRYDVETEIDFVDQEETFYFMYDFRGSVYLEQPIFDFRLENDFVLQCRVQHWAYFAERVEKRLVDESSVQKYDNKFYKFHDTFRILCLSPKQRNDLVFMYYQVRNRNYKLLDKFWESR